MQIKLYFFKRILVANLLLMFVITILTLVIKSLNMLILVVKQGFSVLSVLKLTSLIVPSLLIESFPIVALISILFTWSYMKNNQELIVMQAVGIAPLSLSSPALFIGFANSIIALIMTAYIIPSAYVEFHTLRKDLRNTYNTNVIEAGKFIEINSGVTMYIKNITPSKQLENILIYNEYGKRGPITIIAKSGYIVNKEDQIFFYLNNANFQEIDKENQGISFLNFSQYTFSIAKSPTKPIERTSYKELYLWELLNYKNLMYVQNLKKKSETLYYETRISFFKEINRRFANTIMPLLFTLISCYFLSHSNFNRNGNKIPILKSIMYCSLIKVIQLVVVFAEKNSHILSTLMSIFIAFVLVLLFYLLQKPFSLKKKESWIF